MARVHVLAVLGLVCLASATSSQVDADKNRPVAKVITTLKEMVAQLEKEGEEDEKVYQTMDCWCTTNSELKTQAIAAGEREIADLTAAIEEATANSARLNTEIANLNKEVAKNNEALDSATALRKKQLAEFNAEEKDMLQSLTSLKNAVHALSKHHEAAFLQTAESTQFAAQAQAAVSIEAVLRKHEDLLRETVTPHQRKAVAALVQGKAPQSGEIFGIMSAMKESFETNLAASQKEEAENQSAYDDLKAAKEDEISAGQELIDTKTTELGDTDEKKATSKQSLMDAEDVLAADVKFLADLKEKCKNVDQEFEERTKTRQLEIQAVSKALAFLGSDEAHELFARTFSAASFLELRGESTAAKAASKALVGAAKKFADPRIALLSTQVRTKKDFTAIKETIQTMVDTLEKESKDEIDLRDFCIKELNQNQVDTESKTRDKGDTETHIEDLTFTIKTLTKEIDALKASIADSNLQMKVGGEDREKANTEFQALIADQRATQKLLTAALDILKGFYEKAALVQAKGELRTSQPAPAGFKTYEKNEKSGGVMGMMQSIIDDAAKLEEEATYGETTSQKDYEEFVQETNALVDSMTNSMVNKSEAKAKTEADLSEAEGELEKIIGTLEYLDSSNRDLHKECDYTLENFDARQKSRGDEVDALKQSIAIFSGAAALLQK